MGKETKGYVFEDKNGLIWGRFTYTDPNFDLTSFLESNCFNGIHGEPMEVTLKATGSTARIFAERCFHPSQRAVKTVISSDSLESIIVRMTVARGRGLERFIQSWLPEIEVISPTSLRDLIAENLSRSLIASDSLEKKLFR